MTDTLRLGALIVNRDGHTPGPRYGQIYTASAGERGFLAGYRDASVEGLGLLAIKRFDTLRDAEQYLIDQRVYI